MTKTKALLARIFSKTKVNERTGCWEYQGHLKNGYAWVSAFGKPQLAHRIVLRFKTNGSPKGMECCHSCDNRSCLNPGHLSWGTRQQNQKEKALRGRAARRAVSDEAILEMRKMRSDGKKLIEIGKKFNCSMQYVSDVCLRKRRVHV